MSPITLSSPPGCEGEIGLPLVKMNLAPEAQRGALSEGKRVGKFTGPLLGCVWCLFTRMTLLKCPSNNVAAGVCGQVARGWQGAPLHYSPDAAAFQEMLFILRTFHVRTRVSPLRTRRFVKYVRQTPAALCKRWFQNGQ